MGAIDPAGPRRLSGAAIPKVGNNGKNRLTLKLHGFTFPKVDIP
jgi:hypothetical protein